MRFPGLWPLPTTELTEVLLPGGTQGHLKLKALQDATALRRSQLSSGSRQQSGENGPKVLVNLQKRNVSDPGKFNKVVKNKNC